jgi:CMP-N-acetylneuraminic acid synthetase
MNNYFIENGAIFIFKTDKYLKLKNKRRIFGKFNYFEMPKFFSKDIDNLEDLKL